MLCPLVCREGPGHDTWKVELRSSLLLLFVLECGMCRVGVVGVEGMGDAVGVLELPFHNRPSSFKMGQPDSQPFKDNCLL